MSGSDVISTGAGIKGTLGTSRGSWVLWFPVAVVGGAILAVQGTREASLGATILMALGAFSIQLAQGAR